MCQLSRNSGVSSSWNPKDLSRPVAGKLYLYLFFIASIAWISVTVVHKPRCKSIYYFFRIIIPNLFLSTLLPLHVLFQNCEKRLLASSSLFRRLFVCPSAFNNSAATRRILMKLDICVFAKICRENSNFIKIHKNNGYFTWRRGYIYNNVSLSSS
jgi:hypothetical protein